MTAERDPALLGVMNRCPRSGSFPKQCKRGRLVLIPKLGKPEGAPNSYRPLCLLDTMGKLLKKLILARVNAQLNRAGAVSANQFGFRAGKSRTDACADVRAHIKDWKDRTPLVLLMEVQNVFQQRPLEQDPAKTC